MAHPAPLSVTEESGGTRFTKGLYSGGGKWRWVSEIRSKCLDTAGAFLYDMQLAANLFHYASVRIWRIESANSCSEKG